VTVAGEFRVDVRPYSGYDDPSLPIAAWIAQAGIVGDASGGSVFIDFLFQRSDDPQISELFNLEQLSADTSTGVDRSFSIETLAMDTLAPNRPASPQKWADNVFNVSGVGIAATSIRSTELPLWLGAPNRVEGNGGIRIIFTNINLLLYAVTVQGYMWGPRSVLAQGGPRRPLDGLFG